MANFKKNYLPSQSQPWAKEVETKIDATERNLKTLDVNNRSKDEQFAASLARLDTAARNAAIAAEDAAIAAEDAADAAANAQAAIDGLGSLDEATSTYKINAANLTVGSLSGDRISGGTIIGTQIQTAATGRRLKLESTQASFWDESNNYTGSILGAGTSRGATIEVSSGASGMVSVYSGGAWMTASGGVEFLVSSAGAQLSSGEMFLGSGTQLTLNGAPLRCYNADIQTNGATINQSGITGNTVTSNGALNSASLTVTGNSDLQGRIISAGTYNAVASSTANVLINSNNYFQRTTSSRRYKSDIQDIDYGMRGLDLRPRTWVDKSAYEDNNNSVDGLTRITGFIAEELDELGFTELVQYNEDGLPEAVNYDRITVAIIPVLKQQQTLIEQLTARIEALEAK